MPERFGLSSLNFSVKSQFFDKDIVVNVINKNERRYLVRAGSYIRKAARNSIKNPPKAKKKSDKITGSENAQKYRANQQNSSPGNPPFNQTGKLKGGIFFSYDAANRSVIIGPEKLASGDLTLLSALEFGGRTRWKWKDPKTGNKETGTHTIAARPFMRPAMERSKGMLQQIWKESIG